MGKTAYRILKKNHLILEYYAGEMSLNDIFSLKEKMFRDPNYDAAYSVIHDLRDAILNISESEVANVEKFLKKHPSVIGKRKGACLTANPHDVAIAMLVSFVFNKYPLELKVFELPESAMTWLNISVNLMGEIEKELIKLKDKSIVLSNN